MAAFAGQLHPDAGNRVVGFGTDLTAGSRPIDLGVGLQPTFIVAVALVFSCLLGVMCCFVPRLEGVTLGIAGTLEERWKRSG